MAQNLRTVIDVTEDGSLVSLVGRLKLLDRAGVNYRR